jgi:uncharacterized protein (TIGR02118 family)
MIVLTFLYGHPSDPAAFEEHYRSTHLPITEKIPLVVSATSRLCASLDGSPPPYHRVAEASFKDRDDLLAALDSPEGRAAAEDIRNFADGGVTMFIQHD